MGEAWNSNMSFIHPRRALSYLLIDCYESLLFFFFLFYLNCPKQTQKEKRTDIETPLYFLLKKHNSLLFLPRLEKCFWLFLWIYLYLGNLKKILPSFRCLNPLLKILSFETPGWTGSTEKNWNVVVKCKLALETNSHTCVFQVLWKLIHGASWMLFRSEFS